MIEEINIYLGKKYVVDGKASIEVTAFGFRILVYGILDQRELKAFKEAITMANDSFENHLLTGTWDA